jgi:hypothetical protein
VVVDALSADAAAGRDYLKLRRDAVFPIAIFDYSRSTRAGSIWQRLRNGGHQPLSDCRPRFIRCFGQEGLAVLTELLRVFAIRFADRSWPALPLRDHGRGRGGLSPSLPLAARSGLDKGRAYRKAACCGSLPSGAGPFTKDLGYGLGLMEMIGLLRTSLAGDIDAVSLIFGGKISSDDWNDVVTPPTWDIPRVA